VSAERPNAFQRLFRGETSFDFAGRWRRWFAISGIVIAVGAVSLGVRGLNFSIEFKGGTQWTVPTTASVATVRNVLGNVNVSLRQATIEQLVSRESGKKEVQVSAPAKTTSDNAEVTAVTAALARMAHVPNSDVALNAVGPSWGADITSKAVRAVIIFLIACTIYIWLRFEGKMALAALVALLHDMTVTAGIYSLSGFQVSPDTVIAFLTILGYSLYDTIVVFDKVQENTRGLASTGRVTYTDTVNLSMNAVLARSLNTSFVAILPILSILVIGSYVLGATALNDFGLALLIGLATGAYSSIFIASPLLALLKEREPRYAQIRQRLASRPPGGRRLTPAAAASGAIPAALDVPVGAGVGGRSRGGAPGGAAPAPARRSPGGGSPGAAPAAAAPGSRAPGPLNEPPARPAGIGAPAPGSPGSPGPAGGAPLPPRKRVVTGGRAGEAEAAPMAPMPSGNVNPIASAPGAGGDGRGNPPTGTPPPQQGGDGRPGAAGPRSGNRPPPRPRKKRRR
jgi:preprotein translocase subunit SecF